MNRHTGEESAPLIKNILIELFLIGWKGEFRDLRREVEKKLGHKVHSTFVFRPLHDLQRELVVTCRYEEGVLPPGLTENQKKFTHVGKMLWQAVTTLCLWCGSTDGAMTESGENLCHRCEGD